MTSSSKHTKAAGIIEWEGGQVLVDKEGFLINQYDWSQGLAVELARLEEVSLSPEHWELMNYLREYYEDYDIAPPMRMMVKIMAKIFGDKVNSRYLQALFPQGPAKQGSRFAGLPKPKNCL